MCDCISVHSRLGYIAAVLKGCNAATECVLSSPGEPQISGRYIIADVGRESAVG